MMENLPRNQPALTDDEAIHAFAIEMAQEHDVAVSRAEAAIRSLIARGLIERIDSATKPMAATQARAIWRSPVTGLAALRPAHWRCGRWASLC